MIGKLVEERTVNNNELSNLEIGSKLSNGVYNLIVTQGENTKNLRVVKR